MFAQTATNDELKILRFPKVQDKTGLSKSAIRCRIKSGDFPAPIALGPRAVGFVAHEVDAWLEGLIANARRTVDGGAH